MQVLNLLLQLGNGGVALGDLDVVLAQVVGLFKLHSLQVGF